LASIFIIIAGIRDLAFILNPILLSLVITITILPLPAWFATHGVRGWMSLVLTFLVVLGTIGLVLFLVFIGLAQLTEVVPTLRAAAVEADSVVDQTQYQVYGVNFGEVTSAIEDLITSQRITT